jgi:DNA-directed RNA polymerase specialized sigma24 family protein
VLELIFLHGLTTQETAKQMLLSTATVKRRKADALLELEKMLHDEPQ